MTTTASQGPQKAVRAVTFVLVGIALAYVINAILLRGLRERTVGLYAPWNAMVEGRLATDLIVVGSSRAMVDVDCEPLAARLGVSCFNVGLDGSNVNLQRPLFDTYVAHNVPPKILLLTVDVFEFKVDHEPYKPAQYLPYLDEPPLYDNLVSLDPEWRTIRYLPLYGFAIFGLDTMADSVEGLFHRDRGKPDWRVRGWAARDWPWDGDFEKFAQAHPNGKDWPIEQGSVDALESILTTAERLHTRIVLAYLPEYVEVRRLWSNQETVFARFHEIAQRHRIPFLDFSDDPVCASRSYFYNAEHLNQRGAELFSARLAERMSEALR
jgi:hypothetical protein